MVIGTQSEEVWLRGVGGVTEKDSALLQQDDRAALMKILPSPAVGGFQVLFTIGSYTDTTF